MNTTAKQASQFTRAGPAAPPIHYALPLPMARNPAPYSIAASLSVGGVGDAITCPPDGLFPNLVPNSIAKDCVACRGSPMIYFGYKSFAFDVPTQ